MMPGKMYGVKKGHRKSRKSDHLSQSPRCLASSYAMTIMKSYGLNVRTQPTMTRRRYFYIPFYSEPLSHHND